MECNFHQYLKAKWPGQDLLPVPDINWAGYKNEEDVCKEPHNFGFICI